MQLSGVPRAPPSAKPRKAGDGPASSAISTRSKKRNIGEDSGTHSIACCLRSARRHRWHFFAEPQEKSAAQRPRLLRFAWLTTRFRGLRIVTTSHSLDGTPVAPSVRHDDPHDYEHPAPSPQDCYPSQPEERRDHSIACVVRRLDSSCTGAAVVSRRRRFNRSPRRWRCSRSSASTPRW